MDTQELEQWKYPIGRFQSPKTFTPQLLKKWIDQIDLLPTKLSEVVRDWSDEQLDTPYRPGGWTVRQLIHHIADSHLNSYLRFKWALTEDNPTIKPYDEKAWAKETEASTAPVGVSLDLLAALHRRWVLVMKNLSDPDLERCYIHPEMGTAIPLNVNVAHYAWHSEHHLAQIIKLKKSKNW